MFYLTFYLACLTTSIKMVSFVGSSYTTFRRNFRGFNFSLYLVTCLDYKLCKAAVCFILVVHFWFAQQS